MLVDMSALILEQVANCHVSQYSYVCVTFTSQAQHYSLVTDITIEGILY